MRRIARSLTAAALRAAHQASQVASAGRLAPSALALAQPSSLSHCANRGSRWLHTCSPIMVSSGSDDDEAEYYPAITYPAPEAFIGHPAPLFTAPGARSGTTHKCTQLAAQRGWQLGVQIA